MVVVLRYKLLTLLTLLTLLLLVCIVDAVYNIEAALLKC